MVMKDEKMRLNSYSSVSPNNRRVRATAVVGIYNFHETLHAPKHTRLKQQLRLIQPPPSVFTSVSRRLM